MITHAWEIKGNLKPSGNTPLKRQGLKYENQVGLALREAFNTFTLIHNPWFAYQMKETGAKEYHCSPDYILISPSAEIPSLAIEVKLTYVPEALPKLISLYIPCISLSWNIKYPGINLIPLVIFKNIRPGISPSSSISLANITNHLLS